MTQGLSGKFKLAALLGSIATALITAAAVIFPDAVTSEVAAALGAAIATIVAAFGAYQGKPGEVVPEIGTPSDAALSAEAMTELHQGAVAAPAQESGSEV